MRGKIKSIIMHIMGIFCLTFCFSFLYQGNASKVEAKSEMFREPDSFQNIQGDGKYIGKNYTYHLDMEKVGITGKLFELMNKIENMFFGLEVMIAKVAIYVFYYCMCFDAAQVLSGQLYAVQSILHTAIFEPLMYVVLGLTAIKLVSRILKKNFVGILSDCSYVVMMMVLSVFVIHYSDAIVSNATSISKSVGLEAMVGLNNTLTGENGSSENAGYLDNYAASAAGVLWENMVHRPWLELEFDGTEPDLGLVAELMANKSIEERAEIVKESEIDSFKKESAGNDIGTIIMYLIPLGIKSAIYIVLAAIQIFFQVLAVFFVILAPVILILSMIPGYDFMIIEIWMKKILEFEIGIIISTMMIAFLVFLDNYMFSLDYGWFMCYVLQIITAVSLYLGRKHIFGMFSKLQRAVQSPGYTKAMIKNAATLPRHVKIPASSGVQRRTSGIERSGADTPERSYNLQRSLAAKRSSGTTEENASSEKRTSTTNNRNKGTERNNVVSFQTLKNKREEEAREGANSTVIKRTNTEIVSNERKSVRREAEKAGEALRQKPSQNMQRMEQSEFKNTAPIPRSDTIKIKEGNSVSTVERRISFSAEKEQKIECGNEKLRVKNHGEKHVRPVRVAAFTTPSIRIREQSNKKIERPELTRRIQNLDQEKKIAGK